MQLYWVRVGRVFWLDHASRCSDREVLWKSPGGSRFVELEGREIANLLSDADYWSSEWVEMGREGFGLGSSARATATAIRKQFDAATLEQFAVEWREIEGGK